MPHSICQVAPLGVVKIVLFEDGQETVFGAEVGDERALVLRHRSERMVDLWNNILGASMEFERVRSIGLKDEVLALYLHTFLQIDKVIVRGCNNNSWVPSFYPCGQQLKDVAKKISSSVK